MMQKHPNHKPLLVLLLVLCCVAVAATGTYAAYSTSGYVKRVIAAQTEGTSEALRFSSNYLTVGGTAGGNRLVSVTNTGSGSVVGITVCNYPQNDSSLFNASDITYTISFKVKDSNGNEIANSGITLSDAGSAITLAGGQMSHKLHTLTIPSDMSDMLDKISTGYIEVTAAPSSPSDLSPLSAKLQIVQTAAQQVGWEGLVTGSDVDALNYQIHGTKQGTVTISWNADVVSLSKWSAEMFTNKTLTTNSLTIPVGGDGSPTSYLLQFYWVNGPKTSTDAGFTCSFG